MQTNTYLTLDCLNAPKIEVATIKPYEEAIYHWQEALKPCFDSQSNNVSSPISLKERVKHILIGILLFIPIINVIAIFILRHIDLQAIKLDEKHDKTNPTINPPQPTKTNSPAEEKKSLQASPLELQQTPKDINLELQHVPEGVDPQETINILKQFLDEIIGDLQANLKENPQFDFVQRQIKSILTETINSLTENLFPKEIIEQKLLNVRDRLVELLGKTISSEELKEIKIPAFGRDLKGPAELLNLFDNLRNRILMKQKFYELYTGKTYYPDIRDFVIKSLMDDLPDLALQAIESFPGASPYSDMDSNENLLSVIDYYTNLRSRAVDFQKGIDLANKDGANKFTIYAHVVKNFKDEVLSHRISGNLYHFGQFLAEKAKILHEAIRSMPPSPDKTECLLNLFQINNLIDERQQSISLIDEFLENLKIGLSLKNHYLQGIDCLLDLGMINAAYQALVHVNDFETSNSLVELSFAKYYLKGGEVPLMLEWVDKIAKGKDPKKHINLPNFLAKAAKELCEKDNVNGMHELLNYYIQNNIALDDLYLWHGLKAEKHHKLIALLIYYGASMPEDIEDDGVKKIVEDTLKFREDLYKQMMIEKLNVTMETGPYATGVLAITASYLSREDYAIEDTDTLFTRCLQASPLGLWQYTSNAPS
jgi:hypothetical protein